MAMNDFDFLIGNWRVRHRRLKERLANSRDWIDFAGTCLTRKILGGCGNMDEHFLDLPEDAYHAVAFRTRDPVANRWSIWWIDARAPGELDPPLIGEFNDGVGTFYADHVFRGQPIRVRFLWTDLQTKPRWEQAFSADNGRPWEINWTMEFERVASERSCCPIVELRQYTLRSAEAREILIELFEREFVESQEAEGMQIIGTFRDLQKPDRFVWLRGFQDMESRALQLQQFYGGPVWKKHRDTANATMIDSDNVLLLRPASGTAGFALTNAVRSALGASKTSAKIIVATIYHLKPGTETTFAVHFQETIAPILREQGVRLAAQFISEHHPNTFPGLPVSEDANVFVWFTSVPNPDAVGALPLTELLPRLRDHITTEPELLLLEPTDRSLLRA